MSITKNLHRLAEVIDRIDTVTAGSLHTAHPHVVEAARLVGNILTALTGEAPPDSVRLLAADKDPGRPGRVLTRTGPVTNNRGERVEFTLTEWPAREGA